MAPKKMGNGEDIFGIILARLAGLGDDIRGIRTEVSEIKTSSAASINEMTNLTRRVEQTENARQQQEKIGQQRFDMAMAEIRDNKLAISNLGCQVHEEKMMMMQREIVELQNKFKSIRAWFAGVIGTIVAGIAVAWSLK